MSKRDEIDKYLIDKLTALVSDTRLPSDMPEEMVFFEVLKVAKDILNYPQISQLIEPPKNIEELREKIVHSLVQLYIRASGSSPQQSQMKLIFDDAAYILSLLPLLELLEKKEELEDKLVRKYMQRNGWEYPVGDMSHGEYDMAVDDVKWFMSEIPFLPLLKQEEKK